MPLNNFSGETYVAFSDLNGFKEVMRNHERAAKALDRLYNSAYELKTKHEYSKIRTLAISDLTEKQIHSAFIHHWGIEGIDK